MPKEKNSIEILLNDLLKRIKKIEKEKISSANEIKILKQEITTLQANYNLLNEFLENNLEKVYTLQAGGLGTYREIYRQGEVSASKDAIMGWKKKDHSIGYTFKKKFSDS